MYNARFCNSWTNTHQSPITNHHAEFYINNYLCVCVCVHIWANAHGMLPLEKEPECETQPYITCTMACTKSAIYIHSLAHTHRLVLCQSRVSKTIVAIWLYGTKNIILKKTKMFLPIHTFTLTLSGGIVGLSNYDMLKQERKWKLFHS